MLLTSRLEFCRYCLCRRALSSLAGEKSLPDHFIIRKKKLAVTHPLRSPTPGSFALHATCKIFVTVKGKKSHKPAPFHFQWKMSLKRKQGRLSENRTHWPEEGRHKDDSANRPQQCPLLYSETIRRVPSSPVQCTKSDWPERHLSLHQADVWRNSCPGGRERDGNAGPEGWPKKVSTVAPNIQKKKIDAFCLCFVAPIWCVGGGGFPGCDRF